MRVTGGPGPLATTSGPTMTVAPGYRAHLLATKKLPPSQPTHQHKLYRPRTLKASNTGKRAPEGTALDTGGWGCRDSACGHSVRLGAQVVRRRRTRAGRARQTREAARPG